jgi:hypothetical protein
MDRTADPQSMYEQLIDSKLATRDLVISETYSYCIAHSRSTWISW